MFETKSVFFVVLMAEVRFIPSEKSCQKKSEELYQSLELLLQDLQ